jgi:ParB family chromosome partitioning protein
MSGIPKTALAFQSDTVALSRIVPDPQQPRKRFEEAKLVELAESLKVHGQLVPLLVYGGEADDRLTLIDGEFRFRALQRNGAARARVEILARRPDDVELRLLQVITALKREGLTPVEQFRSFDEIQRATNATPSELARLLSVSAGTVTRVLSFRTFSPEELMLLERGQVSSRDAYKLAGMCPEDRQRILTQAASGNFDRQQMEQSVSQSGRGRKPKRVNVNLATPQGMLRFSGAGPVSLSGLLATLESLTREVRKARDQAFDIRTLEHMLADRSKVQQKKGAEVS